MVMGVKDWKQIIRTHFRGGGCGGTASSSVELFSIFRCLIALNVINLYNERRDSFIAFAVDNGEYFQMNGN